MFFSAYLEDTAERPARAKQPGVGSQYAGGALNTAEEPWKLSIFGNENEKCATVPSGVSNRSPPIVLSLFF